MTEEEIQELFDGEGQHLDAVHQELKEELKSLPWGERAHLA